MVIDVAVIGCAVSIVGVVGTGIAAYSRICSRLAASELTDRRDAESRAAMWADLKSLRSDVTIMAQKVARIDERTELMVKSKD